MKYIKIVRYSIKYKSQILNFLSMIWSEIDKDFIKEKFEWRYENNPNSLGNPFIYIALSENKIVGMRSFVLQRFTRNQSLYNVFTPADALVHPQFRRMGIFFKLNEEFIKDIQVFDAENCLSLSLSSNQFSFAGNLKQGWQEFNCDIKFGYKISIKSFLFSFFKKHKETITYKQQIIKQKSNIHIIISKQLHSEKMSELTSNILDKRRFTNFRDINFFNWRYSFEKDKFFFIFYYNDIKLEGYLILKRISSSYFFLEEYVSLNENILETMIESSMDKLNIFILRVWISSTLDEKFMLKCGFFIEPHKFLKRAGKIRNPILVRPLNMKPTNSNFIIDKIDIRDCNYWQLFHSDIH